jgi:NAD(P)-dependent dehydrogenase (short-subunit alcohol dehydrogenase family)
MNLQGKRILVVGGGSGIGYGVAEAAIADGAEVVIASSNLERVHAAARELGPKSSAAQIDLTQESTVATFFAQAGAFDHIVTTAGDWKISRRAVLAELDMDLARKVLDVRFWGALLLAKHGATHLAPEGSLTFTDGMIAHKPAKGSFVFTAMAGAVEHLTRALAVDLAPLRVNAVCPGFIRTGIWDNIPQERREAQLAEMTKGQLVPRIGTPAEVAEAYLFLMRSGYTTGQVLYVEGGAALKS